MPPLPLGGTPPVPHSHPSARFLTESPRQGRMAPGQSVSVALTLAFAPPSLR